MGDIEKARREIRYARSSADDRRWDQLEPRIKTIETALEGCSDAEKAPVLAELAPMREKMIAGIREEKSGAIEREIKRNLSAAASELSSGYTESPALEKSIKRLASAEAQEWLLPDVAAKLQAEIAALQPKSGKPAPAPPPRPEGAKRVEGPTPAPTPAGATPSTPSAPAKPAPGGDPDRTRSIENDIVRTLKFATDDLANSPERTGQGVERAKTRLDSDDAKQHLAPETIQRLRAQADELQTKVDAAKLAEGIGRIEERVSRHLQQAESDLSHNQRGTADMLRHARERLEMEDAKKLLPAGTVAKFRGEIARIEGLLASAGKQTALENAEPILKELEERVDQPLFDDSRPAYQVIGDLDGLKSRVRGALSEVPADDKDVKAIEKRIAAVDAKIATATAALGREQAHSVVARSWELEEEAIAGWEDETSKEYELPKTAVAVRRLTWFVKDKEIERLRTEFKKDKEIQSIITRAETTLEKATAKLHAGFEAVMKALEKGARPTNRLDLEQPSRLCGQAGGDFEGTKHAKANVARAKALGDRWQKEIEADRAARQAKYDELSAVAAKAWPAIVASIKADDGFDPLDARSKGKTVRLTGIRNRIGWDFSGALDFAMWVGETPVVGNYEKGVLAAVNAVCEKVGLPLDDHTDWDVVLTIGGPGKIKQRFNVIVRDRSNMEIGKIEEWRPVECVQCTVIALRAGPAAVGPKK